jgi:circadian clock protein KaiB
MKSARVRRRISDPQRPTSKLWLLSLYVADSTPKSVKALSTLKNICESYLKGHYRISVIDLLKQPQLARAHKILAIPTVVRTVPSPVRTIIGNLSNIDQVLVSLDLRAAS